MLRTEGRLVWISMPSRSRYFSVQTVFISPVGIRPATFHDEGVIWDLFQPLSNTVQIFLLVSQLFPRRNLRSHSWQLNEVCFLTSKKKKWKNGKMEKWNTQQMVLWYVMVAGCRFFAVYYSFFFLNTIRTTNASAGLSGGGSVFFLDFFFFFSRRHISSINSNISAGWGVGEFLCFYLSSSSFLVNILEHRWHLCGAPTTLNLGPQLPQQLSVWEYGDHTQQLHPSIIQVYQVPDTRLRLRGKNMSSTLKTREFFFGARWRFRTAVPFRGQIIQNLTGSSAKRDRGSKGIKLKNKIWLHIDDGVGGGGVTLRPVCTSLIVNM